MLECSFNNFTGTQTFVTVLFLISSIIIRYKVNLPFASSRDAEDYIYILMEW